MNNKSEQNQDCDGSVCKKVYGVHGKAKELWCKECLKELKLAKQMKKESNAGVCPECGILANNLNAHRNDMHLAEKQVCSLCSLEFRNVQRLYKHKKMVHDDKVPCTECGKLIGVNRIKDHMKLSHTPDDQKKYKCGTCGKGFMETQKLSDHINVHTGEKPYKCKFCSSSFASKGTHAMHERGHIGRGRKFKK
jgi:KRAB domain-containing zinc finger protein